MPAERKVAMTVPAPELWPSMRQATTADRIMRQIADHIAAQRLRPGDRLPPERELAGLLGVSRPSLREALRSLQAGGQVSIRHGSGVFVAEPASSVELRQRLVDQELSLRELYDMREVLELPAAQWSARNRDPERLSAVQAAFDALELASRANPVDFGRLQALDAAFHLRIVEAAGNRFLSQTQGVLQGILATGMSTTLTIPGRLERSRLEHGRIWEAILTGNATAARRAAQAHVASARKAALARLTAEEAATGASATEGPGLAGGVANKD